MSRRLYFVLPDVETSRKIGQDLLLARMEERRMHFLGKRGLDMKDLPEASAAQKTDLFRGIYIGLFAGALTGLVSGLYIYFDPEAVGMQVPPYVIFICAVVGAVIGAWISGPLIGGSAPNKRLRSYDKFLQNGQVVLIIDVPSNRVDEIRKIIKSYYPQAEDPVNDSGIPAIQ